MKTLRSLLLLAPFFALACDAGPTPRPGDVDAERGALGKADILSGSCMTDEADYCGGRSNGACWCDDLCVHFGDCCADVDEACGVDQPDEGPQFCGGFAGIQCPEGLTCVDDPDDSCDPNNGGADCGGICVEVEEPEIIECGGFLGLSCPDGMTCVDFPGDSCDPQNGGADCGGMCIEVEEPEIIECGGFLGLSCPTGLSCVDIPGDGCHPQVGGADCGGMCVEEPPQHDFCGGFAGLLCDDGLVCVDLPGDGCSPWNGGADCLGVCIDP